MWEGFVFDRVYGRFQNKQINVLSDGNVIYIRIYFEDIKIGKCEGGKDDCIVQLEQNKFKVEEVFI